MCDKDKLRADLNRFFSVDPYRTSFLECFDSGKLDTIIAALEKSKDYGKGITKTEAIKLLERLSNV